MRVPLLAALATIALVLAPARGADEATEKELKRFYGEWKVVELTKDGETRKGDKLKDQVWSFKGDKLVPLDNKDDTATIKIDPSKKPAALDIIDKSGDRVESIYKFTGDDKLTICGHTDGKRPTEFASKKGSGAMLFVLERVKK